MLNKQTLKAYSGSNWNSPVSCEFLVLLVQVVQQWQPCSGAHVQKEDHQRKKKSSLCVHIIVGGSFYD